jgi:hypothetical protein
LLKSGQYHQYKVEIKVDDKTQDSLMQLSKEFPLWEEAGTLPGRTNVIAATRARSEVFDKEELTEIEAHDTDPPFEPCMDGSKAHWLARGVEYPRTTVADIEDGDMVVIAVSPRGYKIAGRNACGIKLALEAIFFIQKKEGKGPAGSPAKKRKWVNS